MKSVEQAKNPLANRAAAILAPVREMLTPALTLLLLFQVASGILVAPLFSLFPVYVESVLHLPTTFTGNLRAVFVVFGGVVAFVGAALVDRLGRKPAYIIAMTGVVASGFLFLTGSPAVMVLLGVYGGLMFGLGSVAGQSYLMDSVSKPSLGLATAFFFLTGTVGNAVGNLLAGWLVEMPRGYTLLGLSIVAGQAVVLALAIWRMPSIRPQQVAAAETTPSISTRALLARRDVWLLLMLRFFPTAYWGSVTLLMPLLLFRLTNSPVPSTQYSAASLLASAVCQVVAGRLVDRLGVRLPVLVAVTVLTVAALAKGVLAGQV
ncbi:MAG TPA: MFS transporter, partial [Armatimonadota bacterium]|nr:MFS transporter [Armatimonadota bacterium]